MTAVLTNIGAGGRWLFGIAEVATGWIANSEERKRIRRERRALSRLPNHLLRDVGLEQYAEPPAPIIRHRIL